MTWSRLIAAWLLLCGCLVTPSFAQSPDKKFEDFEKVVKGGKEYPGLFTLHQVEERLFMEIRPDQFDKPLLAPIAIAKGAGRGGETLNFEEQWVLLFRRVGDRVFVVRRNVRFQSRRDVPVAMAVETTYSDSVLMAVPIRTISPRGAVVIDLANIFFTDFGQLGIGFLDRDRTVWHKVKSFKQNIELEVAATFNTGGRGGDDAIIDNRGTTVIIHYGLVQLPEAGYQPRLADDRVGHFLTVVKDFTNDNKDNAYVRYVNRWRLERADGSIWKDGAKLVPPKKRIVFWIEKSVPDEYRAAVREGILEWNKAFEKIGFRDAIEVRQQENEEFEPEDINYNTFRWIASDQGFAIGPSRANPLTGELMDADILFDASMVRFYKQERQLFRNEHGEFVEPASVIEATRNGWNLLPPGSWDERNAPAAIVAARQRSARQGYCQCASHKTSQLGMAMMALAIRDGMKPGEPLTDEMIQQAVKEVTMHEVGHTLGLRHNFKASTMLKNEQLHDTSITRKQGLVGSVMDYSPVNLAPKGVKQGDYFTTTLGPYDYWAIEYAYKPLMGGTEGELSELAKIAERGATPGLDYGTDEDKFNTSDPLVNTWDLGADLLKFASDRMSLADELVKGLADRVVDKGESYQRVRQAFSMMLKQYGDSAYLASRYVGGELLHRDHKGDPNGRDPLEPIPAAKQREALKFLADRILTDKPFQYPPELLRKLGADRWSHWGDAGANNSPDFPLNQRILSIQITALDNLLGGAKLSRVQELANKAAKGEQPLQVAEIFRVTSESVWADLPKGDKPGTTTSTLIRRNLQREHLKRLASMSLGKAAASLDLFSVLRGMGATGSVPADAKSLARMHLRELDKRIDMALNATKDQPDDATRAHYEECKDVITKVLGASLNANQP
ncbi:zinc-dependent metalloprotease [Tuwongella immobilis]|uniref:Peptidase m43: Uncharacterized protein n=1 Tax=Tuwongella immobilis TaxID=692036 RepID=A0A6C2YTC1_9BACT|nr:zinc-dependent metalloprotease [Tuwongella immobilis]VIP04978.1 peptidase m43 : Uncharacterized protein OS=Singulisphaera acidiphila (strain ATCC BAA-1392 / DSM 18658 / VKM B-2454 / MOB10) GN=Sinac_6847 PE=4 SV=1 [Tuwongella immobilis]VTS07314.1 peptidase m43 : Uncharacterized protein OS=Singulisphaera acidiphila (strain ATCC BAA-1392 / DSM 18658 / VKM B-2454 / MOB10) GN=Sinac_6847 PE=4 SV=1 [Tuwongella immobilis]